MRFFQGRVSEGSKLQVFCKTGKEGHDDVVANDDDDHHHHDDQGDEAEEEDADDDEEEEKECYLRGEDAK